LKLKLLLDANIVIQSCRLGVWEVLIERTSVVAPSVVVHTEALFYPEGSKEIPVAINLPLLVSQGKIVEQEAELSDIAAIHQIFDPVTLQGLHPGETEALALVNAGKVPDHLFCSADAAAIQALAMLGHSAFGISLGEILQRVGLKKPLPEHFSEAFFKRNLTMGQERRITGQGLRRV
jgi:hypothetical protein